MLAEDILLPVLSPNGNLKRHAARVNLLPDIAELTLNHLLRQRRQRVLTCSHRAAD